jgi:glycosyltransferase involved in cell wall biosynthesis
MKIALIGPAYPYRGGIAHHSNMLYSYLRKHGHEVDVITFSRQYPKMLYPGAFQEEQEGPGRVKIPSKRLIDSMNALNWVRVGRQLRKNEYDLHIFKFWLPLFGLTFGTIARLVRRKGRKSVLVIVDNLIPHERRPGDEQLTNFFFRYVDMAITQSTVVRQQLKGLYPQIPQRMLPHPTYENFGERLPTAEVRRKLGIEASKVILFFGFVRKYKGLDSLLAAMPAILRRVPDVHLLVVGEFFEDPEPYMEQIRSGGIEHAVTVHNRYVPNEEVAEWFSAADALVLPYHSATNSGIVQIGYNFATPAIVTDVGSLSEVVIDGRTGFVLKEADPESLAGAVARIYEGETIARFSENIKVERVKYSWDAFVEGIEQLTADVQGGTAPVARPAR